MQTNSQWCRKRNQPLVWNCNIVVIFSSLNILVTGLHICKFDSSSVTFRRNRLFLFLWCKIQLLCDFCSSYQHFIMYLMSFLMNRGEQKTEFQSIYSQSFRENNTPVVPRKPLDHAVGVNHLDLGYTCLNYLYMHWIKKTLLRTSDFRSFRIKPRQQHIQQSHLPIIAGVWVDPFRITFIDGMQNRFYDEAMRIEAGEHQHAAQSQLHHAQHLVKVRIPEHIHHTHSCNFTIALYHQ